MARRAGIRRKATPENTVVAAGIRWLWMHGVYCWRQNSGGYKSETGSWIRYGFPGCSDILGILPGGRFIAVECKAGKGKLTEPQEKFRHEVESRGGLFVEMRSTDDLEREVRPLL